MQTLIALRAARAALALTLALAAACALCRPGFAAEGEKGFVSETLSSAGSVLTSPLHMDRQDAMWLGGLAAGGLLVYSADGQIRHAMGKNHSSLNDDIVRSAEKLGNGGYEAAIVGVYGGIGLLARDRYMTATSRLAAESFLSANAAGTLVKYMAGRSRPYAENGKGRFTPFKFKTFATSFPSGHTTSAFSVASVFATRSDSWAVKGLAYGLASCTALQRVYADKHWASDVFAGAALGTAVGRWIARPGRKEGPPSAMLLPVYAEGYTGAAAVLNF